MYTYICMSKYVHIDTHVHVCLYVYIYICTCVFALCASTFSWGRVSEFLFAGALVLVHGLGIPVKHWAQPDLHQRSIEEF